MSRVARYMGTFALLLIGAADVKALDVKSALAASDFSPDAEQKVLAGQFVQATLPTHSERDLGVAIAFLVKSPPEEVVGKLRKDRVLLRVDPQTIAYGLLEGEGTPQQFAGLKLTPAQVTAYAGAAPGDVLNLSSQEVASIRSAGNDPAALQQKVHELLGARYRAYRAKGLAGIAPYARKGAQTDPAAELAAFVRGARASEVLPTTFYDLLGDYPKSVPTDLVQIFYWVQFTARNEDTISLVHSFQGTFGGNLIAVQRQYYVSTGFNTTQAIVGFLPAPGGALVLYTNHTSTDQVTGAGGGVKRKIGRSLMASELEKLFKAAAAAR